MGRLVNGGSCLIEIFRAVFSVTTLLRQGRLYPVMVAIYYAVLQFVGDSCTFFPIAGIMHIRAKVIRNAIIRCSTLWRM